MGILKSMKWKIRKPTPHAKKNSLSLFLTLLKKMWESTAVAGSALVLIWPPPLLFS